MKNMETEDIGRIIIGGAIKVHSLLGPGLLESAYQKCLDYELTQQGLYIQCELSLPIRYSGVVIDAGYRIDMLVESRIII